MSNCVCYLRGKKKLVVLDLVFVNLVFVFHCAKFDYLEMWFVIDPTLSVVIMVQNV